MSKNNSETEISGAPSVDSQEKPATSPGQSIKAEETASLPLQEATAINADDLAGPLAEGMPTPTNADVSQAGSAATPSAPERPEIKDDFGTVFNPDKHRSDAFGNPERKNGRFLSTRGRKAGGKNSKPDESGAVIEEEKPKAGDYVNTSGIPDQFDTAAEMLLQTGYGVAAMFLSDGVRPENDAEHTTLKVPLAAVLREKGVVQLTPSQLLLFSLAAYIGKKSGHPTVKERAVLLYLRIKGFFVKNKQPELIK